MSDDEAESPDPTTDGGVETARGNRPLGLPRWAAAILPLVLLAVVLGAFVATSPLAGVEGGEPLPDVTVTHVTLTEDDVALHVVNDGPGEVTLSQVLVDDAYWSFTVEGGDRTLGPMESRTVHVPYHWQEGWDLEVALVLDDGTTVHHTIVAPSVTPGFTGETLRTLAVLGVFVGVIPVALGMLWFPYIRGMSSRALHAVLAFSAAILAFLALDAGLEALELAERVPGAYEGTALVVLGALGTLLLVQSVSAWRRGRAERGEARFSTGLWVAYLVALGIGLHNLAEGLAIGSSFALGRVSLGTFLVVGFMLHNVTEGPAVVAPLADERRPAAWHFLALGVLAGAPVILGGWIGGFAYSPTLGAFFLATGVGAIVQVLWELRGLVRADGGSAATATNMLAFLAGLVVMYLTDLLVAI
ncbi:metal transporter [Halobacteriales archaeon QS_1_68_20]|nr:MAG: metal transporter [Halobacteriales archaeon QS_1_68_20]